MRPRGILLASSIPKVESSYSLNFFYCRHGTYTYTVNLPRLLFTSPSPPLANLTYDWSDATCEIRLPRCILLSRNRAANTTTGIYLQPKTIKHFIFFSITLREQKMPVTRVVEGRMVEIQDTMFIVEIYENYKNKQSRGPFEKNLMTLSKFKSTLLFCWNWYSWSRLFRSPTSTTRKTLSSRCNRPCMTLQLVAGVHVRKRFRFKPAPLPRSHTMATPRGRDAEKPLDDLFGSWSSSAGTESILIFGV